jgi:hypothetical protein
VHIIGDENITALFLQPVALQCVGAGVPPPSLRWWKDGVALATLGGNLQVHSWALGLAGSWAQVEGLLLRDPGTLVAWRWDKHRARSLGVLSGPWDTGPGERRGPLAYSRSWELQLSEGEARDPENHLGSGCLVPSSLPELCLPLGDHSHVLSLLRLSLVLSCVVSCIHSPPNTLVSPPSRLRRWI